MPFLKYIENYQEDLLMIIENCKVNIKQNEDKIKELLRNQHNEQKGRIYVLSEYSELKNKIRMINKELNKHIELYEIANNKINYILMIKNHENDIKEINKTLKSQQQKNIIILSILIISIIINFSSIYR